MLKSPASGKRAEISEVMMLKFQQDICVFFGGSCCLSLRLSFYLDLLTNHSEGGSETFLLAASVF